MEGENGCLPHLSEYFSPFGRMLPGRYWERVPDASLVFLWCLRARVLAWWRRALVRGDHGLLPLSTNVRFLPFMPSRPEHIRTIRSRQEAESWMSSTNDAPVLLRWRSSSLLRRPAIMIVKPMSNAWSAGDVPLSSPIRARAETVREKAGTCDEKSPASYMSGGATESRADPRIKLSRTTTALMTSSSAQPPLRKPCVTFSYMPSVRRAPVIGKVARSAIVCGWAAKHSGRSAPRGRRPRTRACLRRPRLVFRR